MDKFQLPNDSASELARQQLVSLVFIGFEVGWAERSELLLLMDIKVVNFIEKPRRV